jgi:predicted secreted Zn-dependent protease
MTAHGKLIRTNILAAFALLAASAGEAAEQSYAAYYLVRGDTAAEIFQSIKTSSPKIAANTTMAFTAIATKTAKTARQQGAECRYTRFATSAIYIFNLPKHANPGALSPPLHAKWMAFADYLRRHEEVHRGFWRQCFRDYDAAALELAAKTCDKLDQLREKLFTKIKRGCVAKDEAFDAAFRKEVHKTPFIAEAVRKKKRKQDR